MVHGRQWGVQHDISVKMTHVTTEKEMKERHRLVKKSTPCATLNWKVDSLRKLYSKTSVASLAKKPVRRLWSDFEDSCHDTPPRHATKRVTDPWRRGWCHCSQSATVHFVDFLQSTEQFLRPRHLKQSFPRGTASALFVGSRSINFWKNAKGWPRLIWQTVHVSSFAVEAFISVALTVGPNFADFTVDGGVWVLGELRDVEAPISSSAPTTPSNQFMIEVKKMIHDY